MNGTATYHSYDPYDKGNLGSIHIHLKQENLLEYETPITALLVNLARLFFAFKAFSTSILTDKEDIVKGMYAYLCDTNAI